MATMVDATPSTTGASTASYFADSAINMDLNSSTVSSQSKPELEADQFESELTTPSVLPVDDHSSQLPDLESLSMSTYKDKLPPDQAVEIGQHRLDSEELTSNLSGKVHSPDVYLESDTESESEFETDPELISHLTTTVSSLRLRHQEQCHLQTLFTSKLEALAQRSLQHEATIRSLIAQLESLRDSNTERNREKALLIQENNDLRMAMQDMKKAVTEREMAMEAMTGAVRGLEGYIENTSNSPSPRSQARMPQDKASHQRSGKGVIKGKGRFRGQYFLDHDHSDGRNVGLGITGSADIQEGVMAWVRGFKDVEEGLRARNEIDDHGPKPQINGTSPPHRSHNPTSDSDEDFGDFETG